MVRHRSGGDSEAVTRAPAPDVIVGGVPGAGKTTAIREATRGLQGVTVIDPSVLRRAFRRLLPGAPYRTYRWLVHTLHTVRVVARLLAPGGQLVIHDPGTRPWRRRLYSVAARVGRRRLVEVYLDPTREEAEEGQRQRGRVVRSFAWHWAAWEARRAELVRGGLVRGGRTVRLVPRAAAAEAIRGLLRP